MSATFTRLALVLAVSLLAAPLATEAQQSRGVVTVGFLSSSSPAGTQVQVEAFQQGLRDHGYVEGKHITIERRYADGNTQLLARLAAELVSLKAEVIVAPSSSAALAARQKTSTIPIVFAFANDPVGVGLVASVARPGGNVTGLTPMSGELTAKRLELFKEAVPAVSRIAVLSATTYPFQARQAVTRDLEAAASLLRLDVRVLEVASRADLDAAFTTMMKERVGGVTALPFPLLTGERRRIAELALRHRLPSVFQWREYVEVGGLMSYSANQTDLIRRAASYVDKILKGSRPGDLPVEQATTFELVINLKTAKTLGLTISQSVLRRADQLLE